MAKTDLEGVIIRDTLEIAELSPAMMAFIESYGARQKLLLGEWLGYLVRERARHDAETAVNGFIAICVLVAIAAGFLIVL